MSDITRDYLNKSIAKTDNECICGEINARNCQVHNDQPKTSTEIVLPSSTPILNSRMGYFDGDYGDE